MTTAEKPQGLAGIPPRASVRVQLIAAAAMWMVGSAILLVRGIGYLDDRYWHAWALAAGLSLGVVKARYMLDRVARKAVSRIEGRGSAFILGFFSIRSWALVALMMGGGIALRTAFVDPTAIGAGILGAVYIGVGTALLIADRVFWHAAFRSAPVPASAEG